MARFHSGQKSSTKPSGIGLKPGLAWRTCSRAERSVAVAFASSPMIARRQIRATQCQRYPGSNGTALMITRRSTRSGSRRAAIRPTTPQSWTTSE